ncbi:MAG: SDR family NAD(P)-dependent oxidoreductase [Gammaproteobacteria bacterium]
MSLIRCCRRTALLALVLLASGIPVPGYAADDAAYIPTVLVTGANRGIGLELARQYADRGWRVIGTARKPAEAAELIPAAATKGRVVVEALDVMDLDAIDALAAKYRNQPVDILFNNAGVTGGNENQQFAKNMNWKLFDVVHRTNVVGPLKMAEAFLPNLLAGQMKKISNVSSSQGSIGTTERHLVYLPVQQGLTEHGHEKSGQSAAQQEHCRRTD